MIVPWLPETVTVTTPVTVADGYGGTQLDYTTGTTRTIAASVQPQTIVENTEAGRVRISVTGRYRLFTPDLAVTEKDRVTRGTDTFEVTGVARWSQHSEVDLLIVTEEG